MKTPQLDPLPGCGSLGLARPVARDLADLAQRKANAPLRPSVPQKPAGGLFGDDAAQLDLVQAANDWSAAYHREQAKADRLDIAERGRAKALATVAQCCGRVLGFQVDINGDLQCCGCGSPAE